jgi:hypothetical protein
MDLKVYPIIQAIGTVTVHIAGRKECDNKQIKGQGKAKEWAEILCATCNISTVNGTMGIMPWVAESAEAVGGTVETQT